MANAQESALHYRFGDTLPEIGATLEVASGVRRSEERRVGKECA